MINNPFIFCKLTLDVRPVKYGTHRAGSRSGNPYPVGEPKRLCKKDELLVEKPF
jgi:hypothetical protein